MGSHDAEFYVKAAYTDDDALPRVGDVYRKPGYKAPTSPIPQGTPEYEAQRANFDLGPDERKRRAMAAATPTQAESPVQKGWDTVKDYLDAKDRYLKDPS